MVITGQATSSHEWNFPMLNKIILLYALKSSLVPSGTTLIKSIVDLMLTGYEEIIWNYNSKMLPFMEQ